MRSHLDKQNATNKELTFSCKICLLMNKAGEVVRNSNLHKSMNKAFQICGIDFTSLFSDKP